MGISTSFVTAKTDFLLSSRFQHCKYYIYGIFNDKEHEQWGRTREQINRLGLVSLPSANLVCGWQWCRVLFGSLVFRLGFPLCIWSHPALCFNPTHLSLFQRGGGGGGGGKGGGVWRGGGGGKVSHWPSLLPAHSLSKPQHHLLIQLSALGIDRSEWSYFSHSLGWCSCHSVGTLSPACQHFVLSQGFCVTGRFLMHCDPQGDAF